MSHWSDHASQWHRVGPPLRPTPSVVEALCAPLIGASDPVLVLGVTPELTAALPRLLAVDRNAAMLERLWPGDQTHRQALCADWLELERPDHPLSAAVGDGSLTVLGSPERVAQLLERLKLVLPGGAPLRCRVFVRPEQPWTLEQLRQIGASRATLPFDAFKWMLAMHLAGQQADQIAVSAILAAFDRHWPDRQQLATCTGWPPDRIATIDVYRNSPDQYWFPTAATVLELASQHLTDVALTPSHGYPLAEHCPILSGRTS